MRVLAIDLGFNTGFGAVGDRDPVSGSRRIKGDAESMGVAGRNFDGHLRALILQERPGAIAFARIFVGEIWDPVRRRRVPVNPTSILPLMGFQTVLEMVCDELKIRCISVDEMSARRAFLSKVPRGGKAQKTAVQKMCRALGWPAFNQHASDALCVASYVHGALDKKNSHLNTPLFSQQKHK